MLRAIARAQRPAPPPPPACAPHQVRPVGGRVRRQLPQRAAEALQQRRERLPRAAALQVHPGQRRRVRQGQHLRLRAAHARALRLPALPSASGSAAWVQRSSQVSARALARRESVGAASCTPAVATPGAGPGARRACSSASSAARSSSRPCASAHSRPARCTCSCTSLRTARSSRSAAARRRASALLGPSAPPPPAPPAPAASGP